MEKLKKKLQKYLEKSKYSESYELIRKQLEKGKPIDYAEIFRLFASLLEQLNSTHETLIHNILYYVDQNLTHSNWIVRRNSLEILQVLAKQFPKIFLTKNYLSTLRKISAKDQSWEVRVAAVTAYALIGDYSPDRTYYLLKECLNDEDEDVRLTVLHHLMPFLEKYQEFVSDIIPVLKKIKNTDPHWKVSNFTGTLLETLKPFLEKKMVVIDLTQETYLCPLCGTPYSKNVDICLSCGKEFPRCMICKEIIRLKQDSQLAFCPHCKALAHPEHLRKWVLIHQTCPSCMNPLKEHQVRLLKKAS
ncbi:MAG: HEAT repeat domain-containing protein [Candidatus Helarchaeota archaeon]